MRCRFVAVLLLGSFVMAAHRQGVAADESPDGPFYNTFTWDAKAKGWTFRMESQGKDGKRVLFAEDTLRRP